ncbi:MAG: TolC family protein [Alphaproteobacteria bacterium]|uniref:TolC family protein n=1 Tax=Candidatus Nitrobium versatile TaxID=2884831 RepID=A0A953M2I0_9BACT|nr:TolC family protein [Candidatus Nitrobium versatile]
MRVFFFLLCFFLFSGAAAAEKGTTVYTLSEAVSFALKNNPGVRASGKEIEGSFYGIASAKAERLPALTLNGGITRYRYPTPVTPISGSPLEGAAFPEFENTLYDAGVSFFVSLYRGGRLDRGVKIAEINRSISQDLYQSDRQGLIYNVASTYYKIAQLGKLLRAAEASVGQLAAHKRNVELFLEAGTVPRVELLKAEAELAHARQNAIAVRNHQESAYELLKALMGIEDREERISLIFDEEIPSIGSDREASVVKALSLRPDYRALLKRQERAEERVKLVEGKKLPHVYATGEFSERSGEGLAFKENWSFGVRLSLPLFDGGLIKAEAGRELVEREKLKEEERSLRLAIVREVTDAHLALVNAKERVGVAQKAIDSARETLRIEDLKFESGKGTGTDVIDAQTAVLRAESDYYQAFYDLQAAGAFLRKAVGEDGYREEEK